MDIRKEKDRIRKEVYSKRNALSKEDIESKSMKIIDRLIQVDEFKRANNIMLYVSIDHEVATQNLIKALLQQEEKFVMLPFMEGDKMKISEITNFNELEMSHYGVLEPKDKLESARRPEVIIMPGVAFDCKGNRIGFGKGCYDSFLGDYPEIPKIALAFEEQMLESVPCEPHDIKTDVIITENDIIVCEKKE